jgi:hypothetical protein
MDEKLDLGERFKRTDEELKTTTEVKLDQDAELTALKAEIDTEQKEVEAQVLFLEEARRVNKEQDDKYRHLAQVNASLMAKLKFINMSYDFTSNVNNLNSDDLKGLISSNENVKVVCNKYIG